VWTVCQLCGCIIGDNMQDAHDAWHARIDPPPAEEIV
jgi:transcription initiation factor TFIIIB Brf1 subunit/transcription initiation factor TFIIB